MEELFTKANMAKIERICSKVSNGRVFGEDAYNELRSRTSLKLLESKSYDSTRALEPYVWRIAMNVANDMSRENAKRRSMFRPLDRVNEDGEREMDYAVESLFASELEAASFHVEEVDFWNAWEWFKNCLDETDRAILELCSYNVGKKEIAERLGCTPNSVSVRLCRLRKLIKKGLVARFSGIC